MSTLVGNTMMSESNIHIFVHDNKKYSAALGCLLEGFTALDFAFCHNGETEKLQSLSISGHDWLDSSSGITSGSNLRRGSRFLMGRIN